MMETDTTEPDDAVHDATVLPDTGAPRGGGGSIYPYLVTGSHGLPRAPEGVRLGWHLFARQAKAATVVDTGWIVGPPLTGVSMHDRLR